MNLKEKLGKQIQLIRKKENLTQEQLSKIIKIDAKSISKIEKGECEPRANILVEMSKYFGVSIDYILGISDVKNYVESSKKYSKTQNIGMEYQEKINQLSEESQRVARSVVDRLTEIERM